MSRTLVGSVESLILTACRAALADAGLAPSAVDGINVQTHHGPAPDQHSVAASLGLGELRWMADGGFGVDALSRAAIAVDEARCDVALVCKVMTTSDPIMRPSFDPSVGVTGPEQFELPYGLGYTMQRAGLSMRRWMHRYGVTSEQIGWLCVAQRRHALRNPQAVFDEKMSLDDYLASRWVADPLRLYDCDYPVNGAFAYLVCSKARAGHLKHRPVEIVAWAGNEERAARAHLLPDDPDWPTAMARTLYADAKLGPADMDVWMLYDGFSFFALQWMENLGLVGRGDAGAYVEGGERIGLAGEHPLNTHGGQLSEGRMHGTGHILEAVHQLRGTAAGRQLPGAKHAIVTSSFPNAGSALILSAT